MSIVGLWSSEGPSGSMVDPFSGSVETYYSGSWWIFREDNTYRFIVVGSGPIISGIAVNDGKYTVIGNKIIMKERDESWFPDPRRPRQQPGYKHKPLDGEEIVEFEIAGDGKSAFIDKSHFYTVKEKKQDPLPPIDIG